MDFRATVIGFSHNASVEAISPERITAFRAGLAETGPCELMV